jgi:hypothetical protein
LTVFGNRHATKRVKRSSADSVVDRYLTLLPEGRCGMAKKGKGSSEGKYRSAISGRYVTKQHGKRSPKTTVKESK